jgi:hypothetical protein
VPTSSPMHSVTPPLRRMVSDPFVSRTGTRLYNGQLTYDHFAPEYPQVPIRRGYVGVQRDKLRSWSWTRRLWLVLHDKWLYICQREVEFEPPSETYVV